MKTKPKPALLLIDLQVDYFDPTGVGSMEKAFCVPGVRRLLDHARHAKWPLAHVVTRHKDETTLPRHLRDRKMPPYALAHTQGESIIRGLHRSTDRVFRKRMYSGFDSAALATFLSDNDPIILAGIATDCCVLHTAFDAATEHGKQIVIPLEAVSASQVDDFAASLHILEKSVAYIIKLDDLVSQKPSKWARYAIASKNVPKEARSFFARTSVIAAAFASTFGRMVRNDGVDAAVAALAAKISDPTTP
jgi:nicotinamidase-related amidase